MPLVNEEFVREEYGFTDATPSPSFIENRIIESESELRALIGDTRYDEAEAVFFPDPDAQPTPIPTRIQKLFRLAECKFIMYFAIPFLNLKISDLGIVLEATSKNFGDANYRIATPSEVKSLQETIYAGACKIIREYIITTPGVLPAGSDC
jgi:hypothetical protein